MNFLETVTQRRSVKHYDATASMNESDFKTMMDTVLLSPTSYNIQHWRFVRIQDRHLRTAIQKAAWDQAQITEASELIVVCADIQAWKDQPERYWADADQATRDMLLPMIENFYTGKEQLQRDEAIRSCAIAAQTLMLTAKALGYDSNPMIGFEVDEVAELIKLPEDHLIAMMVVVGKAARPARPRGGQLPLAEVLVNDRF